MKQNNLFIIIICCLFVVGTYVFFVKGEEFVNSGELITKGYVNYTDGTTKELGDGALISFSIRGEDGKEIDSIVVGSLCDITVDSGSFLFGEISYRYEIGKSLTNIKLADPGNYSNVVYGNWESFDIDYDYENSPFYISNANIEEGTVVEVGEKITCELNSLSWQKSEKYNGEIIEINGKTVIPLVLDFNSFEFNELLGVGAYDTAYKVYLTLNLYNASKEKIATVENVEILEFVIQLEEENTEMISVGLTSGQKINII